MQFSIAKCVIIQTYILITRVAQAPFSVRIRSIALSLSKGVV